MQEFTWRITKENAPPHPDSCEGYIFTDIKSGRVIPFVPMMKEIVRDVESIVNIKKGDARLVTITRDDDGRLGVAVVHPKDEQQQRYTRDLGLEMARKRLEAKRA